MAEYVEQVGASIRRYLAPNEVVLGATPAGVGAIRTDGREHRSGRLRGAAATVVEASVEAERSIFAGKVVLVATDQRLLVFAPRRWRSRPGRYIDMVTWDALGNIEGVHASVRQNAVFELVLIMTDGAAVTLQVPARSEMNAKQLVRRVQARLRS